jgi:hypothetical protein
MANADREGRRRAMELTRSPMSRRQRDYRQVYRSRIAGWYDGYVHIGVVYAIGFAALYIYIANIRDVAWWEWLTVPVVFLGCNFFEWFLHARIMHRPQTNRALRAIYVRHTLMHHQFFTQEEMRFAGQHDWRVTVFPPYALVIFILMSIPGALAVGWLVSANAAWLLMCTTTGIFLVYEFMHFCCHIEDNAFVRHCPFVNTLRRHHSAHHNQGVMMETNMNLTFPISDWLFGTSDLDRGLLGTLFNGYDESHLRTDLRRSTRAPAAARVQVA